MCCLFDRFLAGTVFLGGISTATTTSLQYTGYIDDWKAVVIPSVITFIAIMGCVLRCACRTQSQTSVNTQTVIINTTSREDRPQVADEVTIPVRAIEVTTQPSASLSQADKVTIPVGAIEVTTQPSASLSQADVLQKVHQEWRESRSKS